MRNSLLSWLVLVVLTGTTLSLAGGKPPKHKQPLQTQSAQLRVRNVGSVPIENLIVFSKSDKAGFGTLKPHALSCYRSMPKGVYSQAAFSFVINGKVTRQVAKGMDAEKPMIGHAFTYDIDYITFNDHYFIELVEVTRDT